MVDFVEICSICARKAIIEAAKRIIKSYSDLNFGVTFLEHSVVCKQQSIQYIQDLLHSTVLATGD